MFAGVMVREALVEEATSVPVIVAVVVDETGRVEIENVAVVVPARTVTFDGVEAPTEFEDNVTTVPPLGDAPFSVTVPVELVPPVTEIGETVSEVTVRLDTATDSV